MDFRNRSQPPHFDATGDKNRFGATEAAPSAAWLAAQNAFRSHEPVRQDSPPVVVVRKTRISTASQPVVEQSGLPNQSAMAVKSPRVFRVEIAGRQSSDTFPSKPVRAAIPQRIEQHIEQRIEQRIEQPAEQQLEQPTERPRGARRRRELSVAHAPGPVLQIYRSKSLDEPPVARPVSALRLSLAQISVLKLALATIGRTIEQTQFAGDLNFISSTSSQAWNAFSADLQRIRMQADRLGERKTADR